MAETTLEFITLRPPQRIRQGIKRLRYIRDLRPDAAAGVRGQLEAATVYRQKLVVASAIVSSPLFFTPDRYYTLNLESAADLLRTELIGPITLRDGTVKIGAEIAPIISAIEVRMPLLKQAQFFHDHNLPPLAVAALFLNYAAIWDSLYGVTVMAGFQQVETNHMVDAIRVMHLLTVLRLENLRPTPPVHWPYFDFSTYEVSIRPAIIEYQQLI
jgi:hypothetical protein